MLELKNIDKLINLNDMPSDPFAGLAGMDLSWNTVPSHKEEDAEDAEAESDEDNKASLDDLDSLMG